MKIKFDRKVDQAPVREEKKDIEVRENKTQLRTRIFLPRMQERAVLESSAIDCHLPDFSPVWCNNNQDLPFPRADQHHC